MRGVFHARDGRPGSETTNQRGLGVSTGLQPRPGIHAPNPTGVRQEQMSPTGLFCFLRFFRAFFRPFISLPSCPSNIFHLFSGVNILWPSSQKLCVAWLAFKCRSQRSKDKKIKKPERKEARLIGFWCLGHKLCRGPKSKGKRLRRGQ